MVGGLRRRLCVVVSSEEVGLTMLAEVEEDGGKRGIEEEGLVVQA